LCFGELIKKQYLKEPVKIDSPNSAEVPTHVASF
jgi:hypothetical protein